MMTLLKFCVYCARNLRRPASRYLLRTMVRNWCFRKKLWWFIVPCILFVYYLYTICILFVYYLYTFWVFVSIINKDDVWTICLRKLKKKRQSVVLRMILILIYVSYCRWTSIHRFPWFTCILPFSHIHGFCLPNLVPLRGRVH